MTTTQIAAHGHRFDSQADDAPCTRGDGCTGTRAQILAAREQQTAAAATRRAPKIAKDAGAGSHEARLARNEHRRNRYARTGR